MSDSDFTPIGKATVLNISSTTDLLVNFGGYSKLFVQPQGGDARYGFEATDPSSLFILVTNDARVFKTSSDYLKFKGTTLVVQPGK